MIRNKTTGKVIAKEYKLCESVFSTSRGLMLSRKKNLIFDFKKEKIIDLHMLFVFFKIWAVYLNEAKEVVFIKKLFPFVSTCFPTDKARYVIELVEESKVKVGDVVEW